jgi:hypothetical protein
LSIEGSFTLEWARKWYRTLFWASLGRFRREDLVLVYLAGKITGDLQYKQKFSAAYTYLKDQGYNVLNPAVLPEGMDYEDAMKICLHMVEVCDAIALMPDWKESPGAKREKKHAEEIGMQIMYLE